jgi:hypothetical protein
VEWRARLAFGLTFIDIGLNQWGHTMRGVADGLVNPLCVVLVLGGLAVFAAGISLGMRLRRGWAEAAGAGSHSARHLDQRDWGAS